MWCNNDAAMRIISKKTIVDFYEKHADAKIGMEEWHKKVKDADWYCSADVKETFNSVDSVGNDRYVFNIKGNTYRLIAMILFQVKRVYIRFVGTHAEYDKIEDASKE